MRSSSRSATSSPRRPTSRRSSSPPIRRPFGAEVLVVNPRIVGKRLGAGDEGRARRGEGRPVEALPTAAPSRSPASASSRTNTSFASSAGEGLDAASFDGIGGRRRPRHEGRRRRSSAKGVARDFIRLVQVARKDAGFNVADRIHIEVKAGADRRTPRSPRISTTVKRRDAGGLARPVDGAAPAGFVVGGEAAGRADRDRRAGGVGDAGS